MSKEKIIVALDVPKKEEAREIIDNLRGEIGAFKIGMQLFTSAGSSFVREVVESGVKVFLDLKFHDIPNTVAKASIEAARLGVWMFNVHTLGGSEMMRRAASEMREVCEKENLIKPLLIGVTILTSSTDETLREIGLNSNAESQVLKLAQLASECGLDGVVASPKEAQLIRQQIKRKDFKIVTPGVRLQTDNQGALAADDQKRIMTSAAALNAGADYLVIGRPILQAANPVTAVQQILTDINNNTGISATT